jgi:prepilin-type N-terminal cleavage/methylation domain-containing protein
MKRRAGLTLIEVVIVLAVLAVVGVVLVLRLVRMRELTGTSRCKVNISSIAKALAIYTSANKDRWPWIVSDNQWNAPTGASQQFEPNLTTNYNVSALLFCLVHDYSGPIGIFVCPSTSDTVDPNTKTPGRSYGWGWNWDFSPYRIGGTEHVSYSYQAPMRDANGSWGSGVTSKSSAGLVILADKTPTYDGQNALFNWADPGKADPKAGMSQNHKGEMINLLYADLHVGDSVGRADVGINNDNIYSCADSEGNPPRPATEQGPGSLDLSNHVSPTDSFLLGPKKMDK